eukprot:scaffold2161_cov212-Alexandrium_tamarense.AAC.22
MGGGSEEWIRPELGLLFGVSSSSLALANPTRCDVRRGRASLVEEEGGCQETDVPLICLVYSPSHEKRIQQGEKIDGHRVSLVAKKSLILSSQSMPYTTRATMATTKLTLLLSTLLSSSAIVASATAENQRRHDASKRRRRRRMQASSRYTRRQRRDDATSNSNSRRYSSTTATKLDNSNVEVLRERWIDLLSYDASNAIRLETREEEDFYYSAEILADKLLGYEDVVGGVSSSSRGGTAVSDEISTLWRSIAIGSSGLLFVLPTCMLFSSIFTTSTITSISTFFASFVSSMHSSITPHLIPTITSVQSSIQSGLLQAQAIVHSLPYFLRHLNRVRIRPLPLIVKIVKKCLIIEAWRHIWVRVYKLTRYIWRGTLHNANSAYVKFTPAWIRRGIKSMFQSMVQAHIHGVVGSTVGGVFGGITFESLSWSTATGEEGGVGDSMPLAEGMLDDGVILNALESSIQDTAMEAALSESIQDALDSGLDASDDVIASATEAIVQSALESTIDSVENAVESTIAESISESLAASVDDVLGDVVESVFSDGLDLDAVVDSVVDASS